MALWIHQQQARAQVLHQGFQLALVAVRVLLSYRQLLFQRGRTSFRGS
ncbi:hypothetical protein GCM10011383_22520 [Hymenobacter cavernae]|uniref:Uncharacterized protein n=1 Tax=Hymenobacter cavernae TaxID=2044852 RepID=A0ABQ1U4S2_9BACT|nr:hypothetical protein GCM10011383_22520 [Hymenobacter cavernae]